MIIENVEALKSWLAKLLEPICDADPSALANYVVALVKKDKPEKELKALCADQLDVFLQKETTGFVDKLFECLTTKNYLGSPAAKETPKEEVKPPAVKPDAVEAETPEEERENRWRRSPLRNRSDFESRNRDDRRREERKRRDFERHGKSSSDSHRERERHERRRGSPRGRSYSRSRSRSGSRGKDREHRGGRDFKSKFEVERKDTDGYNSSTTSGPLQQQHPPPLLPTPPHPFSSSSSSAAGISGPGGVPVATMAHLPDSTTDSWSGYYGTQRQDGVVKPFSNKVASLKQRCRDYDEKGFCVRGDLCLFDHGNDPLIVDDVNLPNMIPFPPPPVMPPTGLPMPPTGLPMPPITEPPPNLRIPPMPPYGQPPPPGVFPLNDNYDPEGYNPESPALTAAGRNQYRQFIPRVQTQRSNLIGLTSNEGQGSRAANIVIQTEPVPAASAPGSNVPRFNAEQDNRKRTMGHSVAEVPAAKKPWMEKPNFNNQHKSSFPKRNHYVNTKLEVRKIPRDLNNITKLNEHFSKFGTIVNIQVVFGGDPEAALIQYTMNEEARRAISSIEAVLNNRFIRVYWHREPGTNPTGLQQPEQSSGSQLPGLTPSQGPQHGNMHKQGIKQHCPAAYVLNKTVPKHRLAAAAGATAGTRPDCLNPNTDAAYMALALTNPQKNPYTSTALKLSSKSFGKTGKALEAQEVLKKKQEALKLQQDMRKKKQEMLQTQIECQKALINRLEKNRGMKPEERANIMKTLKEMTDKITQLQNEMNPASQFSRSNHSQSKTKTDAQKELLDAELDFHKKMSSGEDTTDLKRKLGLLQVEATRLGLIRPPTGRGRGRGKMAHEPGPMHMGRGRGRSREMMGRGGAVNRMVVDHRPRALAILGVTQQEKEELMPHFVKYGEIEDLRDQDANTVVMTFKTRSEAENAANQGAKFKGRVLQISWYKPKTPSVNTEPEEEEAKDEDNKKEPGSYLPGEEEEEEEDDDEDDEYESRSWRR
ncbi:RNA-binding protein 27 isoform X3 [Hippoglossus hippoglossus]|uniref:RNA-binding protein 27 isoform X3 n=1 Tax=Hippoglossus hippoglossus TaxID=8267 RepID=UPI00148CB77B|nr:RNA-binding protein 27 isoform X3 [Hippoglossus hippoglossus]XP_035033969.1 RNA-binding protein 27 isoform X3 [Hippoglossus stenolepis]